MKKKERLTDIKITVDIKEEIGLIKKIEEKIIKIEIIREVKKTYIEVREEEVDQEVIHLHHPPPLSHLILVTIGKRGIVKEEIMITEIKIEREKIIKI